MVEKPSHTSVALAGTGGVRSEVTLPALSRPLDSLSSALPNTTQISVIHYDVCFCPGCLVLLMTE